MIAAELAHTTAFSLPSVKKTTSRIHLEMGQGQGDSEGRKATPSESIALERVECWCPSNREMLDYFAGARRLIDRSVRQDIPDIPSSMPKIRRSNNAKAIPESYAPGTTVRKRLMIVC